MMVFVLIKCIFGLCPEAWQKVCRGGVHVERDFVSVELASRLRKDAASLQEMSYFTADGLTNTATKSQNFSKGQDRQTLRGLTWFDNYLGDAEARREFFQLLKNLREEASNYLERPLAGSAYDETSYNYYAPGASLALHLDEYHEETKGLKGWTQPTRRSLTWLLYINEKYSGGQLRCFPVTKCIHPVGAASNGDLQVAWKMSSDDDTMKPVFLGETRCTENDLKLYTADGHVLAHISRPFQLFSSQPSDVQMILASSKKGSISSVVQAPCTTLEIEPTAGTLVLFDSVVVPHQVLSVRKFPRFAVTGWFHELLPPVDVV